MLLANSADSFGSAISQYMSPNADNSNYKHVILLLDHSIEILLQARLCLENKSLILRNQKSKKLGKTIGFGKCVLELRVHGISLGGNFESAIFDLHEIRNDIWHFGFLGRKDRFESLISYCSCVYWVFLMKHLPRIGVRQMLDSRQFSTLLSFDKKWHLVTYYAAKMMSEWHTTLDVEQERYSVSDCTECRNLTLVADTRTRKTRCKCCGYETRASAIGRQPGRS